MTRKKTKRVAEATWEQNLAVANTPDADGRAWPPCPRCGNDRDYIGIDTEAYARQSLVVNAAGDEDDDGYDAYESEIGAYTQIECAVCKAQIWNAEKDEAYIRERITRLQDKLAEIPTRKTWAELDPQ